MQGEKKLLLMVIVLLWLPFYVVIQQWNVPDDTSSTLPPLLLPANCSTMQHVAAAATATAEGRNTRRILKTANVPFIHLKDTDIEKNDILMVYGANAETMKQICSVLPECAAFNSKGWIKLSTGPKMASTDIDVYIKDTTAVLNDEEVDTTLTDPSAGAYTKHMDSYQEMEQNLKIFIYPVTIGTDMPSVNDYKYGVEQLFIDLLQASHYSVPVKEADQAHFYFIPTRCTAYRKSQLQNKRAEGELVAMKTTRDMVNHVIQAYPYWNRSSGADHFYICAHDMGTNVAKLSHIGLQTNAIALVNTADYSKPLFMAHKDISLPVHPGRGVVDWSKLGMGGAGIDPKDRTSLMFFAGNPSSSLRTTKFCLCPSGLEAWSPRLMDALWFGCVPVIISDRYVLPLRNLLNWDDIAYRIPESQVTDIVTILQNIPEKELRRKQLNIIKFYQHLTWNQPPRPYDAFHSVLFQLWQRRHLSRSPPRV
ncbi:uncharacterized protein [Dysidea avara]|uniref:uncharacterized protein isoform X2 n=1 Tax=Dysidea avara TaxID=196820 RepID=UPI0033342D14